MAWNEYYVDPASGNDTTGNGTSGTPWKSVQKALTSGTLGADGIRINVKAGTADVLTAGLSTSLSIAADDPLIIQGYTSTAGDGGIGEIDGNDSYSIMNQSGYAGVIWADMKLGNVGNRYVVYTGEYGMMLRCYIHTCSYSGGAAVRLTNGPVIDCRFDTQGAGLYSWLNSSARSISGCYFEGADYQLIATSYQIIQRCIFVNPDTQSVRLANNTDVAVINNTFFCSSGAASRVGVECSSNERRVVIHNNIFEGFSGSSNVAINAASVAVMAGSIRDNYFYNNTTDISGSAPDVLEDSGNEKAAAATCIAKSGSLGYTARLTYFLPLNVGAVYRTSSGGYKGAIQPRASSYGLLAGDLENGVTVDDVTGTLAAGGGGGASGFPRRVMKLG